MNRTLCSNSNTVFSPSNLNKLQHDTEIVIRIPGAEYGARGRGVGEHILSSRGPVFAP
jgi:hypothetical protein